MIENKILYKIIEEINKNNRKKYLEKIDKIEETEYNIKVIGDINGESKRNKEKIIIDTRISEEYINMILDYIRESGNCKYSDKSRYSDESVRAQMAEEAKHSIETDYAKNSGYAEIAEECIRAQIAEEAKHSITAEISNEAIKLTKEIKVELNGDIIGETRMDENNNIIIETKINKEIKDIDGNKILDLVNKIGKFDGGIIGNINNKNNDIILDISRDIATFKGNIIDERGNIIIDIKNNRITGKLNSNNEAPLTAQGKLGDKLGDIAFDNNGKMYYCTEDYNNEHKDIWIGLQLESDIWK